MKYLKKFNEELKSSTYKSAADKLNPEHGRRPARLAGRHAAGAGNRRRD